MDHNPIDHQIIVDLIGSGLVVGTIRQRPWARSINASTRALTFQTWQQT